MNYFFPGSTIHPNATERSSALEVLFAVLNVNPLFSKKVFGISSKHNMRDDDVQFEIWQLLSNWEGAIALEDRCQMHTLLHYLFVLVH